MKNDSSDPTQDNIQHRNDEINLVELFHIFWRWKWFVLVVAGAIVVLGTFIHYTKTPLYTISAQLKPGISGYDEQERPFRLYTAQSIQTWINQRHYEADLSKYRNSGRDMPNVKCVANTGLNIATLRFSWPDPSEGQKILNRIIDSLSDDGMENGLKLESLRLQSQIDLTERLLSLLETNYQKTRALYESTLNRLADLEEYAKELNNLRLKSLTGNTAQTESIFYANAIQQNLYSSGLLQKSLVDLDGELNDCRVKMMERKNEIESLKKQLATLSLFEVVREPVASPQSENLDVVRLVLIFTIVGIACGTIAAFIGEFFRKNKMKIFRSNRN